MMKREKPVQISAGPISDVPRFYVAATHRVSDYYEEPSVVVPAIAASTLDQDSGFFFLTVVPRFTQRA